MSEQLVRDMMAQIIRVGFVAGRQPERMRVKVEFRDTVNAKLVSDWLPVLTPRAHIDRPTARSCPTPRWRLGFWLALVGQS